MQAALRCNPSDCRSILPAKLTTEMMTLGALIADAMRGSVAPTSQPRDHPSTHELGPPLCIQAKLAMGMLMLGAVIPDATYGSHKVAPSAAFDFVVRVRLPWKPECMPSWTGSGPSLQWRTTFRVLHRRTVTRPQMPQVIGKDGSKMMPLLVERQTLLLSVLHDLSGASSPIASINISDPRTELPTTDFPVGRYKYDYGHCLLVPG